MDVTDRCDSCQHSYGFCPECRVEHCSNAGCPRSAHWLYRSASTWTPPTACARCDAALAFCQRCEERHCGNKQCFESNYRRMQERYTPRPCWTMVPSWMKPVMDESKPSTLTTAEPSSYMPVMQSLERRLDEIGRKKASKRLRKDDAADEEEPEPAEKKHKLSVARSGSQAARNTVQRPSIDVGVVTWNINHTGAKSNPAHKAACVKWLFAKHEWLDVLILQEVNSTMPDLGDCGLQYAKGPMMKSLSWAPEPETETDGRYVQPDPSLGEWAYIGQREHYVAVYRDTVEHLGTRAFYGDKVIDAMPDLLYWAKEESDARTRAKQKKHEVDDIFHWSVMYPHARPVIIHDFRMRAPGQQPARADDGLADPLRFSVAIIHTTPEGAGMGRKGEFDQVSAFLTSVDDTTRWIIGGDYYLDEDASVTTNSDTTYRPQADKFGTRVAEMGMMLVTSISASNRSSSKPSELPQRKKKKKRMQTASQQTLQELVALDERLRAHKIDRAQAKQDEPLLTERLSDRVFLTEDGHVTPVVNKIADFFICTPHFPFARAGLVRPTGGLLPVDPNHNALNWWGRVSDHMPVGGIFATRPRSTKWCLAEVEPSADRVGVAQKQLDEIVSTALYEISSSVANLCQRVSPQQPVLVRAILFWDALLSDPYLVRLGAQRPDIPREGMAQVCANVTDEELVDFMATESARTSDVEPDGVSEEIHNICIHLPRLWLGLDAFDLTPEAETYEGIEIPS